MKKNITSLLCASILGLITLSIARATPLPFENPFSPQQPTTPSQTTPSSAEPGTTTQSTPESGMPELPTTTTATSTGVPEGLTNQMLSVWHQDQLTGDWGGFRDEMLNHGVAISPTWIGEVFGNPSGGARRGLISDGLFNVALDLNLDRMSDSPIFDNTLIHTNALYVYGSSLSNSFVGDFSNTSNIAAYNSVRLQELWLQKAFWQQRINIKVGNMAVDTEFFQSSSASLFINGTFGAFTFIASNVPNAPVYPLASPGVRIQFLPTSAFYVMAGVYGQDVNSDPAVNNKNGTRFALDSDSGMLIMSEAGYLLNQSPNDRGLQGTYRVGSFVHTDNSTTFASQAANANGMGNLQSAGTGYGVYGVVDQQIYTHGAQAISLFVRSGGAPSNTNFVDYYVDGGFNFTGFIPGRDYDVAGIAVARSKVSSDFSALQEAQGNSGSTAETVLEATYKMQIAPWWSIQPDFQYIITPSGMDGSHNATVLGLRTSVTF
jgi:porin